MLPELKEGGELIQLRKGRENLEVKAFFWAMVPGDQGQWSGDILGCLSWRRMLLELGG